MSWKKEISPWKKEISLIEVILVGGFILSVIGCSSIISRTKGHKNLNKDGGCDKHCTKTFDETEWGYSTPYCDCNGEN